MSQYPDQGFGPPQGPGMFGSTLGAMGVGAPYGMSSGMMNMSLAQSGTAVGGGAVNALGNFAVPAAVTGFSAGAFMVAPWLQQGARTMGQKALLGGWRLAGDPFMWAGGAWRGGRALGAGLGAAAGLGTAGAGAMGIGLGLAAGALPVAAGLAATEALMHTGTQMWAGANQTMVGRGLLSQVGASAGIQGQPTMGQGAGVGAMMGDFAQEMGTGVKDVARLGQEMNQMRMFQTTRSLSEFTVRFKELLTTVKDVAKTLQTTLDDALGTMGELRQQGFYTDSDIKAQSVKMKARELGTGASRQQQLMLGSMGAQTARAYNLRGRFGSEAFQQNMSTVMEGMRSGTMSEEEIMEQGGPEAVAARISQRQMGFLSTARGRVVIAAMMGEGGAPDPEKLRQLFSGGMTTESLVTTAAGRGLGVLQQAGGREAKEQMLQYAGMAKVAMAASQAKQLWGGVDQGSLLTMMGTMGGTREQNLQELTSLMTLPKALEEQQRGAREADMATRYDELKRTKSVPGQVKGWMHKTWEPVRGFGASAASNISSDWEQAVSAFTGYETFSVGSDAGYQLAAQFGKNTEQYLDRDMESPEGVIGPKGYARRMGERYSQYASVRGKGVINVGDSRWNPLDHDKYLSTDVVRQAAQGAKDAIVLSDEQRSRLRGMTFGRGGFEGNLEKEEESLNAGKTLRGFGVGDDYARAYAVARRIGVINMDPEEFAKAGVYEQERIRSGLQKELATEGARRGKGNEYSKLLGDADTMTGAVLTGEQARQKRKEYLGKHFKGGLFGTGMSELGQAIQKDEKVQLGMTQLVSAFRAEGGEAKERTVAAMDRLRETLGEGSEAYKQLQGMYTDMQDTTIKDQTWTGRKGTDFWMGDKGQEFLDNMGQWKRAEILSHAASIEDKRIQSLLGNKDLKLSESQRGLLGKIGDAGRGAHWDTRRSAITDLYRDVYADQKVSADEAAMLGKGGTAVDVLMGKDKKDKKAMEMVLGSALGTEGAKTAMADLGSLKGTARLEKILGILGDRLDLSGAAGGTGDQSIEGIQAGYIEANLRFVTAVEKFITTMSEVYGIKIDQVAAAANAETWMTG